MEALNPGAIGAPTVRFPPVLWLAHTARFLRTQPLAHLACAQAPAQGSRHLCVSRRPPRLAHNLRFLRLQRLAHLMRFQERFLARAPRQLAHTQNGWLKFKHDLLSSKHVNSRLRPIWQSPSPLLCLTIPGCVSLSPAGVPGLLLRVDLSGGLSKRFAIESGNCKVRNAF